jgi:hypothetical protein
MQDDQGAGMNLEVIGASFGPCYHMSELFRHPEHMGQWRAAMRGEPVDWERVLGDYRATVDWAGCTFYEELLERNPDAKVILTVRDPRGGTRAPATRSTGSQEPPTRRSSASPVWSCREPGRSTAPAGSFPS